VAGVGTVRATAGAESTVMTVESMIPIVQRHVATRMCQETDAVGAEAGETIDEASGTDRPQ